VCESFQGLVVVHVSLCVGVGEWRLMILGAGMEQCNWVVASTGYIYFVARFTCGDLSCTDMQFEVTHVKSCCIITVVCISLRG